MAQFNVDGHLSNGQRLDWQVPSDEGESADHMLILVRQAAMKMFGGIVWFNRWDLVVARRSYVTVRMHA